MSSRPIPDPARFGIHLLPAAGSRSLLAPVPRFAGLGTLLWRVLDRGDFSPLAHLLVRYPALAVSLGLPTLTLSVLFFLMSDAVALLIGLVCLLTGLVFAMTAAQEMARNGLAPSTTPHSEDIP